MTELQKLLLEGYCAHRKRVKKICSFMDELFECINDDSEEGWTREDDKIVCCISRELLKLYRKDQKHFEDLFKVTVIVHDYFDGDYIDDEELCFVIAKDLIEHVDVLEKVLDVFEIQ